MEHIQSLRQYIGKVPVLMVSAAAPIFDAGNRLLPVEHVEGRFQVHPGGVVQKALRS